RLAVDMVHRDDDALWPSWEVPEVRRPPDSGADSPMWVSSRVHRDEPHRTKLLEMRHLAGHTEPLGHHQLAADIPLILASLGTGEHLVGVGVNAAGDVGERRGEALGGRRRPGHGHGLGTILGIARPHAGRARKT